MNQLKNFLQDKTNQAFILYIINFVNDTTLTIDYENKSLRKENGTTLSSKKFSDLIQKTSNFISYYISTNIPESSVFYTDGPYNIISSAKALYNNLPEQISLTDSNRNKLFAILAHIDQKFSIQNITSSLQNEDFLADLLFALKQIISFLEENKHLAQCIDSIDERVFLNNFDMKDLFRFMQRMAISTPSKFIVRTDNPPKLRHPINDIIDLVHFYKTLLDNSASIPQHLLQGSNLTKDMSFLEGINFPYACDIDMSTNYQHALELFNISRVSSGESKYTIDSSSFTLCIDNDSPICGTAELNTFRKSLDILLQNCTQISINYLSSWQTYIDARSKQMPIPPERKRKADEDDRTEAMANLTKLLESRPIINHSNVKDRKKDFFQSLTYAMGVDRNNLSKILYDHLTKTSSIGPLRRTIKAFVSDPIKRTLFESGVSNCTSNTRALYIFRQIAKLPTYELFFDHYLDVREHIQTDKDLSHVFELMKKIFNITLPPENTTLSYWSERLRALTPISSSTISSSIRSQDSSSYIPLTEVLSNNEVDIQLRRNALEIINRHNLYKFELTDDLSFCYNGRNIANNEEILFKGILLARIQASSAYLLAQLRIFPHNKTNQAFILHVINFVNDRNLAIDYQNNSPQLKEGDNILDQEQINSLVQNTVNFIIYCNHTDLTKLVSDSPDNIAFEMNRLWSLFYSTDKVDTQSPGHQRSLALLAAINQNFSLDSIFSNIENDDFRMELLIATSNLVDFLNQNATIAKYLNAIDYMHLNINMKDLFGFMSRMDISIPTTFRANQDNSLSPLRHPTNDIIDLIHFYNALEANKNTIPNRMVVENGYIIKDLEFLNSFYQLPYLHEISYKTNLDNAISLLALGSKSNHKNYKLSKTDTGVQLTISSNKRKKGAENIQSNENIDPDSINRNFARACKNLLGRLPDADKAILMDTEVFINFAQETSLFNRMEEIEDEDVDNQPTQDDPNKRFKSDEQPEQEEHYPQQGGPHSQQQAGAWFIPPVNIPIPPVNIPIPQVNIGSIGLGSINPVFVLFMPQNIPQYPNTDFQGTSTQGIGGSYPRR